MASLLAESGSANVGANAASTFTLGALQTVLMHGSEYFTICDLDRLEVTSKTISGMAEETGAWKRIFANAAASGARCTSEFLPESWNKGHKKSSWSGEQGLLECFSNPSPQVLASCSGYKRATKCLLSKSCALCGKMAGDANPVLMMRVCLDCSNTNENLWIMAKSKAKEAFLLSEKDCNALRSANIPFSFSGKPGSKESTSVILLMSDVVAASFAKYGGADGLAAEFAKRKNKARSRYNKKQNSDKPQKKRPKIEKLSDRPVDDLASLRYLFGVSALVIPTVTSFAGTTMNPKMTFPTKCIHCNARGTTHDIVLHEQLEHDCHDPSKVEPVPCPPFERVSPSIPNAIIPPNELVELLSNASIMYKFGSQNETWEDMNIGESEKHMVTFAFGEETKLVVAVDRYIGTEINMNSANIFYQQAKATPPIELISLLTGDEVDVNYEEASSQSFASLNAVLGLQQTSSCQLIAAIIARALPVDDFVCLFRDDEEPTELDSPVLFGTLAVLKACLESNEAK